MVKTAKTVLLFQFSIVGPANFAFCTNCTISGPHTIRLLAGQKSRVLDGSLMWMFMLTSLMTRLRIERKSGKFWSKLFVNSGKRSGVLWGKSKSG